MSDTPKYRKEKATEQYNQYMGEVAKYLSQVQGGRRLPRADKNDARFSQVAENQRMGLPATAQSQYAEPGTIAYRRESLREEPQWYHEPLTKTPPVWGFHEPTVNAGPGLGVMFDKMVETLADPRNAWLGLGVGGVGKRFSSFFGRKPLPPDSGGFAPTLDHMRSASPDIHAAGRPMQDAYTDHVIGMNKYVENFNPRDPMAVQDLARLSLVNPRLSNDIDQTAVGLMRLQDANRLAKSQGMEGPPPPTIRDLFGFGN